MEIRCKAFFADRNEELKPAGWSTEEHVNAIDIMEVSLKRRRWKLEIIIYKIGVKTEI